jgi:hypothetical protein
VLLLFSQGRGGACGVPGLPAAPLLLLFTFPEAGITVVPLVVDGDSQGLGRPSAGEAGVVPPAPRARSHGLGGAGRPAVEKRMPEKIFRVQLFF